MGRKQRALRNIVPQSQMGSLRLAVNVRRRRIGAYGTVGAAFAVRPAFARMGVPPGEPRARSHPMPIVNRVADLHAEITAWRQDLHAHPELLYDVHRTAASVAGKLKSFGCDDVVAGIGRTGVVGVSRGRKP